MGAQRGLTSRVCGGCGITYQPYRDWQRACSQECARTLPKDDSGVPGAYAHEFTCDRCGSGFVKITLVSQYKYCDTCRAAANREKARLRMAGKPHRRDALRRDNLRRKYGITPEEYDELLAQQSGVCAICGLGPSLSNSNADACLNVDHDHDTGQIRGLLCAPCNRGLGQFKDRIDLLEAAAKYITAYEGVLTW